MFKKITSTNLDQMIFKKFRNNAALMVAGTMEKHNNLTIGWGGLGILWRKEVAIIYVKPTRYTYQFLEESDTFSIIWLDEEIHSEIVKWSGANSGRDFDKDQTFNLTPIMLNDALGYQEAAFVITCRKIYADFFKEENFYEQKILDIYSDKIFHKFYIGEILEIYKKSKKG